MINLGRLCDAHKDSLSDQVEESQRLDVITLITLDFFAEIDPEEFDNNTLTLSEDLLEKANGCPCCYLGATGNMIFNKAIKTIKQVDVWA